MSPALDSKHFRILVIEDLYYEYAAIESAIEDVVPDCTFVGAQSVAEAEGILEEETQVDLIILDWRLGKDSEDGDALLEPNRAWHRRRPPVIVCTALPNVNEQNAYDVGASAFVGKLDEAATEKLQEAVTGILLGEAHSVVRPTEAEGDMMATVDNKPEAAKSAGKPLDKRRMEEEPDSPVGTRHIARILARCTGALEVLLMLSATGSFDRRQSVLEATGEESFLETITELCRCDLVVVKGMEFSLTERGEKVVEKLRRWSQER